MTYKDTRFFLLDDEKLSEMIYELPETWWSRPYEYAWVKHFCAPGDVVLDAAGGVCHPLRFWLAKHCKKVHSCDIDENINLPFETILSKDSLSGIDRERCEKLLPVPENLHSECASITDLPYADKTFDKIFCISVLEHLDDYFNSKPKRLPWFSILRLCRPKPIYDAMVEFKRVLKDDGQLILTFDYPDISLQYVKFIAKKLGYRYLGGFDESIPDNVLEETRNGRYYYAFRAVLTL